MLKPLTFLILLSACLLVLNACRGVDDNDDDDDIDAGLTLGITDGPTEDADEVVITFTGVEIKPANDVAFIVELRNPEAIDLLDLQNGERELLLDDYGLDDDNYSWVRLIVDDSGGRSYIRVNGGQFPLTIPEEFEDNLQINRGFSFTNSTFADFTIDIDLRKSIYQDSKGDYIFRPSLRVVETLASATITGSVADPLVDDLACIDDDLPFDAGKAVYLFQGAGASVQDIQDIIDDEPSPANPIATATVYNDQSSNEYRFQFHYLEDGDYTAVFTCFAQNDDPITEDDLIVFFSDPVSITLTGGVHDPVVID